MLGAANRFPTEIEADKIIRELRAAEAISVWDAEHETIEHPFPGMEFLTGTLSPSDDWVFCS